MTSLHLNFDIMIKRRTLRSRIFQRVQAWSFLAQTGWRKPSHKGHLFVTSFVEFNATQSRIAISQNCIVLRDLFSVSCQSAWSGRQKINFFGVKCKFLKMEISEENAHLSSGYGDDFMSLIDDDLLCLICQPPLREPVLTRNGHRFCRQCLEQHLARFALVYP